jgi:hypothetical protein
VAALGDFVSEIARRLYDLHAYSKATLGDAAWVDAVRPGNRLERFLASDRKRSPFKREPLQIVWDIRPTRFGPAAGPARSTNTFDRGAAAARLDFESHLFQIEILHPDLNYANATALYTITRKILTAAGPQLVLNGSPLPYVSNWGPLSGSFNERATTLGSNPTNLQQLIQLPVNVFLASASVLGT